MKTHRFIGDFVLKSGKLVIKEPEIIHQIRKVLKLTSGEKVVLCDGQGVEAEAQIVAQGSGGIELEVNEVLKNKAEPAHQVALYCAVLKKENFELVCQKATEAGATEIIPVVTERTVKLNLKSDRLEKIIREAAEQSGRGVVPRLAEVMDIKDALHDAKRFKEKCLFDPSGRELSVKGFQSDIALFIGPEGGWSPRELSLAKETGFNIVSLGPRILRGETAATIATFLAAL